jgi:hypothetical protein
MVGLQTVVIIRKFGDAAVFNRLTIFLGERSYEGNGCISQYFGDEF